MMDLDFNMKNVVLLGGRGKFLLINGFFFVNLCSPIHFTYLPIETFIIPRMCDVLKLFL